MSSQCVKKFTSVSGYSMSSPERSTPTFFCSNWFAQIGHSCPRLLSNNRMICALGSKRNELLQQSIKKQSSTRASPILEYCLIVYEVEHVLDTRCSCALFYP